MSSKSSDCARIQLFQEAMKMSIQKIRERERKRTSGNLNYETERLEVVKNLSANAGDITDAVSIAGLGRSLGGEAWQPTITGLDIWVQ